MWVTIGSKYNKFDSLIWMAHFHKEVYFFWASLIPCIVRMDSHEVFIYLASVVVHCVLDCPYESCESNELIAVPAPQASPNFFGHAKNHSLHATWVAQPQPAHTYSQPPSDVRPQQCTACLQASAILYNYNVPIRYAKNSYTKSQCLNRIMPGVSCNNLDPVLYRASAWSHRLERILTS